MFKYLFSFVLASIAVLQLYAQDVIIKNTGDEIKAKVTKVGDAEVEYRKFEQKDGPVYTMKKTDIFMIKYQDGTKDVFNQPGTPLSSPSPTQNSASTGSNPPAVNATQNTSQQRPGSESPEPVKYYPYTAIGAEIGSGGSLYFNIDENACRKGGWGYGAIFGMNLDPTDVSGSNDLPYSGHGGSLVNDFTSQTTSFYLYAMYNISNSFNVEAGAGIGWTKHYLFYNDPSSPGYSYYTVSNPIANFGAYGGIMYLFHKHTKKGVVVAGKLGFNTSPGDFLLGVSICY